MKRFVSAWVLILATGCGAEWPKGTAKRHADAHIAILNASDTEIDDAGVYMGKYRFTAGVLISHATKTYVGWGNPITTNAVLRWRDSKAVKKEETVSLVGIYDPKVKGVLTFAIGPTNVTAHFNKWDPK